MQQGFSFDRALMHVFRAPHAGSFLWQYALSYALVVTCFTALIGALGWQDFLAWFQAVDAAATSSPSEEAEIFAGLFGPMMGLFRWGGIGMLGFWVIWAIFEAASQRRYVRGEAFKLRFGGDEMRMMGLGFFWSLLGLVTIFIPLALIYGGLFAVVMSEDETTAFEAVAGWMIAGLLLAVLMFPLYVFLATRLAPSFGLTIKERRLRFFDAWNVSRGRFWPILGAFVIIVIVGSLASQIIQVIIQMFGMTAMLTVGSSQNVSEADIAGLFLSPGFLIPIGIMVFAMMAIQGFLQHAYGGPAALAALHDPRNDPLDRQRVDIFS